MPRIGMNPGRGKKSAYQPARVTVAVLTYLPNQLGYFQDRLAVVRACLESILVNTQKPYDLMVFDNASCPEAVAMLDEMRRAGQIDFLLLSQKNLGKIGALKMIFATAPGEIIAYSDDDVFFLPGWLERHLQVIDSFPRVGAVTGMYIKPHMKEGVSATLEFAQSKDVQLESGNLVDLKLEQHYIEQTGRTWERYREEIEGLTDYRLTYKGVQVFASAGHYQMTGPKEAILKSLPAGWSGNLMGQMRDLDIAINDLNFLRLCTSPPTIRLLGNQIDAQAAAELHNYGVDSQGVKHKKAMGGWQKKFYQRPLVKKIAYGLYERLFRIINA